jgi:hypothetical protein
MDNPEKEAIKNGQSRERGNEEWTIQRKRQLRMDNPEKLEIKNAYIVLFCFWFLALFVCVSSLVHQILPVTLDCPFLIANFSGLSILDCQFLWIVHSY